MSGTAHLRKPTEPTPIAGFRWIPLTKGLFTRVCEQDFEDLNRFSWCVVGGYAARSVTVSYGPRKQVTILMHRVIMNANSDQEVDHRDRDKFNNSKENLRIASRNENVRNTNMRAHNTSGFKGVSFHKASESWIAGIRVNNIRIHLGLFATAIEAAHAYDAAARLHHGEFAVLNFP